MSWRTFTAEEVNAALELVGRVGHDGYQGWDIGDWQMMWTWKNEDLHIAALALGVPPEGVDECGDCGDGWEYQGPGWMAYRGGSVDRPRIESDDWSGIVRSGQAEIAGRLIAARVELERLRAQKKERDT